MSSSRIARCILYGITAHCETESSPGSGLPSAVDRPSAERKSSVIPRRTDIENPHVGVELLDMNEERSEELYKFVYYVLDLEAVVTIKPDDPELV